MVYVMIDQDTAHADRVYFFGPFCLSPRRRLLLEDGAPVRIGSRALEILIALTEKNGELVTKYELIARVWPTTVVVDANLPAQMSALRRALRDGCNGNRYIVNEPSRGYRFVAPLAIADEPQSSLSRPAHIVSPGETSAFHLIDSAAGTRRHGSPLPPSCTPSPPRRTFARRGERHFSARHLGARIRPRTVLHQSPADGHDSKYSDRTAISDAESRQDPHI
jgi:DNA-binding winged helix-turn-helix (wHTH) protein